MNFKVNVNRFWNILYSYNDTDYECKRGTSSTTALIIIGITGLLVAASALIIKSVAVKR